MMKLYGFPPTRSIRVLWPLRELGVDFELGLPELRGYMERMYARPKAPPRIAEAFASVPA